MCVQMVLTFTSANNKVFRRTTKDTANHEMPLLLP